MNLPEIIVKINGRQVWFNATVEVESTDEAVSHRAGYVDGEVRGQDIYAEQLHLVTVEEVEHFADTEDGTIISCREDDPERWEFFVEGIEAELEKMNADAPASGYGRLM